MTIFKPKYLTKNGIYKETKNYALKFERNGEQIVKTLGTPNRQIAEQRARQIIARTDAESWEAIKPKLPKARKVTIEKFVDLYREYGRSKDLRSKTMSHNIGTLVRIAKHGEIKSIDGLREAWDDFIRENDHLSPASKNSFLRAVRSLFSAQALDFYSSKGYIISNPFKDLKPKRVKKPFKGYSATFLKSLHEAATAELREAHPLAWGIFLLSAYAGMRRQEILWARWEDLSEDSIFVRSDDEHQTKSGEARIVHLPRDIVEELLNLRESPSEVFIFPHSVKRIYFSRKTDIREHPEADFLANWLRRNGLNVNKPIHELRKIYGAVLSTRFGLYAAKEMLGHSSITTTQESYAALLSKPVVSF